ncbi:MAG: sigma-70 family RNA polymerase sigma factor [Candidatus Paceibacterota bacterium]|jgi:RNA polymerase sigma-70 factor (ECF subfamily)
MIGRRSEQNEITLVRKATEGESPAFGALYDKYQPSIYRFIFLKVSHREEAEDLTHQVFLSAWEHMGSFHHGDVPFASWLYRIARNKVIDHYRTRKIHIPLETAPEEIMALDAEMAGQIDTRSQLKSIYQALMRLSDDQRDILIMRFVNELSYKDIAHALDKNQATVRVIQYRALTRLKKLLNQF